MPKAHSLPQPLVDAVAEGRSVLFLGAGFSHGVTGLGWNELLEKLKEKLPDSSGWESLDALDRAQLFVQAHGREALERELAALLPTPDALREEVTDFHRTLLRLPFPVIVTTNYDGLVEATLADLDESFRVVVDNDEVSKAAAVRDGCRLVVKMHGDLLLSDTIVLTREDYLGYESTRPAMVTLFESLLLTRTFFFFGFGLSDPNFLLLYQSVIRKSPHARTSFAMMKEPNRLMVRFWSKRGVDIVSGRSFGEMETTVRQLATNVFSRRAREWELDSVLALHFPEEQPRVEELLTEVRERFCHRLSELEPFLWVDMGPDDVEAYRHDAADDVLGAFRVLRALGLAGFPVDPDHFGKAAELLVRFGLQEDGRTALNMALWLLHQRRLRATPVLRGRLGRVLCRLGEFERAQVLLERALDEGPADDVPGRMAELAWLSRCVLHRVDKLRDRRRDRAVTELIASFLRKQATRLDIARTAPPSGDDSTRWSTYYVNYRVGRIMALASEMAGESGDVYAAQAVEMLTRAIGLAHHKPDPYRALHPLLTEDHYGTKDADRWAALIAGAPPTLIRRLLVRT